MDNTYSSKYSGEQVDAAVEYFLNHSQTEESNSYEYTNTIFCRSDGFPASPFNESSLPTLMPLEFPFAGIDGKLWYDVPNTSTKDWYQCILKINFKSKKVVSQSKVLDMTGAKGDAGQNGSDGKDGSDGSNGADGSNGSNGNHTEFRYKRANAYAITLTDTQRESRFPEGWSADWSTADVESWADIKEKTIEAFCSYLATFSSLSSISSPHDFFILGDNATYEEIAAEFQNNYQAYLVANSAQQAEIMKAFKEYRKLYIDTSGTIDDLTLNMEYHRLYKTYNDEDHLWLLFMISATISGEDDSLIGEWSVPQRIQGNDGKPGPSGSNGIDGIPGVNIGVAFTLGNEDGPRPDAKDPTTYPYNTNYNALFASGTFWKKSTPTVTKTYPYIWFTQCRYIVNTDSNGTQTYEFEDSWSTPARYTGLNGITITETVYRRNPIIYPQGIYTVGVTYINDGARTPYVYYNGNYYYLSREGYLTGTESSTPDKNSDWWTLLEGFEALYTKVGIIANGLIGSAVFNGEYMFSQQGVDQNGTPSSKYERFLQNYATGDTLVNPYDPMAAFKPNFCINFMTGKQWSTSMNAAIDGVNATIDEAKSEAIQSANQISMTVTDLIKGELKKGGITITANGAEVTGKFSGTSDGTFNGNVSAKSLSVIGDDGSQAMVFDTYRKDMGTPSGGVAPEIGTPVLIMNFKGNQYLVSMLKLVTGSSTGHYKQTQATTESLYVAGTISMQQGVQGSASYHCITAAPYLTLLDNNNKETNTKIIAKLYDSSDNEVSWSTYLNKYYQGTLVSEYPKKTDLDSGIWAFQVTGYLANISNYYNGTPDFRILAVSQIANNENSPLKEAKGTMTQITAVNIHCPVSSSVYSKISITNGELTTLSDNKVVVGYDVKWNGNSLHQDSTRPYYLRFQHITTRSAYLNPKGNIVTSSYFASTTSSLTLLTDTDIDQCEAIVSPGIIAPIR